MFDTVAPRYDLLNSLLSLGADRHWRDQVFEAVQPRPGMRILDLAAGTGTSSAPFAAAGATVVPADISIGMLAEGRRRHPELSFTAADALQLPFADGVFDAVTISYGLRNIDDTEAALREMRRVTRPGGQLVVNEFSTPTSPAFRKVYRAYLHSALPVLSRVASNTPAYAYLVESILGWPDQEHLAQLMERAGWQQVAWKNLTGGIVALHRGLAT